MIASTRATITVGSPVAWLLAALARRSAGEDGLGGGQQHQVRLLGGHLQERAAGQRVAERVLAPRPRRRSRCRPAGRGRACRRAADAAWFSPPAAAARTARRRPWRCRPGSAAAAPSGGRELARNVAVTVTSASATYWYICWASRLSGSSTVTRALGGGGVLVGHPAAERAPGEREQDQVRQQRPQRGGCRGGRTAGCAVAAVRGGLVQRGGHEPISAICCLAELATAAGSGWNPHRSRYDACVPGGDHPASGRP